MNRPQGSAAPTLPKNIWAPICAFAATSSANQMAWLVFAPIATSAGSYYHVSAADVGVLSEIFPLLYVLLAVPAGRLVDKSMTAWLAIAASLDATGALVRLGATGHGSFAWALGGQVLVACAQPLLLASLTSLARRYLLPAQRAAGIAVGSAGTFAGFILAYAVAGSLGGGRPGAVLAVGAGYSVATCGVFGWFLWRYRCAGTVAQPALPAPSKEATKLRSLWADPVMRDLGVLVACGFGVFVSLTTWAQTLLVPARVSAGTVDALLTAMLVAGALTSAVMPGTLTRHGRQLAFIVVAGLATIAACAVLAAAPGRYSAAICLFAVGALLLPCLPVMLEVTERRYNQSPAMAANFLWLAGNAGGIVAAVATGAESALPWLSFATMGFFILLAVPSATRLRGKLGGGDSSPGTGTPGEVAARLVEQRRVTT
ncbi:MAG TPA: MFS transporter [Acidimicrobiales bacterium]|nr:MFS transporter [Acidimicrobiales bacterium]